MTDSSAMASRPPRANVLGIGVHALHPTLAVELILQAAAQRRRGYVCVTGVHGVMEAQRDPGLLRILNTSFLTTPDGMPTVWIGRAQGHRSMRRVYGPDLMLEVCRAGVPQGLRHFLYGGAEGVADLLADALRTRIPGLEICGTFTPPFRPLDPGEESQLFAAVAEAKPDCFWVGLSTPKQERFMAAYLDRLPPVVMLGVGAAFDLHTGRLREAPDWMKASGLQWLHRLLQEPRRLARRYLINNPRFAALALAQLAGLKKYPEPIATPPGERV